MGEFRFKQFAVSDDRSGMKISTDGVLLGAWAGIPEGCRRVADLGAGSGLIALMLAQRLVPARPDAEIFAVELD
ncbi:MAG: tRNA (adenosine(37)-N6)-methyltransferase TrmM, partial [Lachnoclostridium sp.]|nr:tRNA (adenosine(37)-N6)-methyltransferase TrmM [Lachnoclostridium sp.]